MAVNPQWGLMQPVDVGGKFQAAWQQGKAQRAETETNNALSALARDPNADVSALAQYNPKMAYELETARRADALKKQQAQQYGDALTGKGPSEAVAYFNPEAWIGMDDRQREETKQGLESIGQLALWADTREKWDSALRNMAKTAPEAMQWVGRFGEREAVIFQTGEAKALIEGQKPDINYVPADAQAYAGNAAGEGVLQAMGRTNGATPQAAPQAPPQQPSVSEEEGRQIVTGWEQAGYATRAQIATIKSSMGGNQQAVDQFIQNNGLAIVDEVQRGEDGRDYYLINGTVYDNPRGQ
jgi:hypothetical protein